jgi:conjugative transposon TraM protein
MKDNNQTIEGKQTLTSQQKQKMKKYAVFALMFIVFGASLWLIFAPSADEKAKTEVTKGFNADIPMPKEEGIVGDKKSAYEEEQLKQKQDEKMRSLQDFAYMLGDDKKASGYLVPPSDEPVKSDANKPQQSRLTQSSIQTSANAYRDINRTLGTFYESPKEDPEKERLVKELEELKTKLAENQSRGNTVDEQLALMEKSYQIAAKYMPQTQGQNPAESDEAWTAERGTSGKTTVVRVSQVTERTVSALQQDMSSVEIARTFSQPRNIGFFTVGAETEKESRNTISACIHDDQTIMDGQTVRLRLLEKMQAGSVIVPSNTIITGVAKIQGERLGVSIVSLEYAGIIIPVELRVYDTDGQAGICIPNPTEINAIKEVAANMGTSAGTSISLTNNAGQQLAADLGRGVIQGTSQYVSKKLREVKVSLKAGYIVFLLPNDK